MFLLRCRRHQNLRKLALILGFFYTIVPAILYALPSDSQQPASIQADQANYDRHSGEGVYSGHVVIKQGTMLVEADRVITFSSRQNKITKAIATGNPAHYQVVQDPAKPPIIALAQKIIYDPIAKQVWLIGNAKVTQGQNMLTSSKIFYDMTQQHVVTYSNQEQRTTIVFQPDQVANKKK